MTQQDIKNWTAAQDWSLRDSEISRQTGVRYATVRNRRQQAHIPPGKASSFKSKWCGVDWSKPDSTIAKERGVTRQCVNQYRKRFDPSHQPT